MQLVKKTQNGFMQKSGAFGRALERVKAKREAQRGVRIGFIVDATGSREASWEQAQTVQGRMFQSVADLGRVFIRLVHFGGHELTDHGWSADTHELAAHMAAVRCRTGGTQILQALRAFLNDADQASAVILVGDAFEEDEEEAELLALPERIKRHAPAPTLRPDGSWRARADEVDRLVREQQEAQKAKSKWAARTESQQAEKLGSKFRRSTR